MRFVFTPPADHAAGLLTLPWSEPLAEWQDERLVEIRQRGISRHVVRFVYDDGTLYALKELSERLARREYRLLRALAELSIPAVEVVGIAVDLGEPHTRPEDSDAILVTKFLSYATTYRAVFSNPRGLQATDGLLDALAELLVRLHLSGFFWGDCSLSNTLFRYDAGTLEAYLVDAETSEQHPALTDGQRHWDVELAIERVFGELLDLQAGEMLPADVEPMEIAEELERRYESLWQELTREEILRPDEQRYRIAERLHRLNELGFDADEVELISTGEGNKLRLKTRVAESGHDSRKLFLRTGIDAGENQARRLLNDMAGFRAWLEQKQGRPVSEVVAANRWLEEVYDPVIAAIPEDLRGRLPPAEIFHEVLEHRWYMSEAAGRDVGTTAAARDYFEQVLPAAPEPLESDDSPGDSELLEPLDEACSRRRLRDGAAVACSPSAGRNRGRRPGPGRGTGRRPRSAGVLLDASPEPAQCHQRGDGHDHGHHVEHLPGGAGEVRADERRDGGDIAVAALQLGDLRRLRRRGRARHAPGDERGGDPGPELGDQDRAEDGEPEAGAVVADGLGDAGGLAVGVPGGPVDRVGVGLAEHEPHAGPGHDDVDHLGPGVQVGRLPGPQREPDCGQGAAEHHRPLGPGPVQHPAADLGADHEAEEEVQDEQAGRGRLLCQRHLPVHAGEEEHRDERHHGDAEDDVLHR